MEGQPRIANPAKQMQISQEGRVSATLTLTLAQTPQSVSFVIIPVRLVSVHLPLTARAAKLMLVSVLSPLRLAPATVRTTQILLLLVVLDVMGDALAALDH